MSDMKCPLCGKKLVKWIGYADNRFWTCYNVLCEAGRFGHIADECIWQELIRTRKALDVARNGLIDIFGYEGVPKYVAKHVRQVLDQSKIETALEQKDK